MASRAALDWPRVFQSPPSPRSAEASVTVVLRLSTFIYASDPWSWETSQQSARSSEVGEGGKVREKNWGWKPGSLEAWGSWTAETGTRSRQPRTGLEPPGVPSGPPILALIAAPCLFGLDGLDRRAGWDGTDWMDRLRDTSNLQTTRPGQTRGLSEAGPQGPKPFGRATLQPIPRTALAAPQTAQANSKSNFKHSGHVPRLLHQSAGLVIPEATQH